MIRAGLISFLVTLCFFQEGVAGWCFGKSPSKCTTFDYATQYINRKCFRIKECERVYMASEGKELMVNSIKTEANVAKISTPEECRGYIAFVIGRENYKIHPDNIKDGYVLPTDVKVAGTLVKEDLTVKDFTDPPYAGCRTKAFLLEMTRAVEKNPNHQYSSSLETEGLKACLDDGCRKAFIETLQAHNRACKEKNSPVRCRLLPISNTPWGAAKRNWGAAKRKW